MTDHPLLAAALAEAFAERGYWREDYQNRDHANRVIAALGDKADALEDGLRLRAEGYVIEWDDQGPEVLAR